jgi:hypothetical protein
MDKTINNRFELLESLPPDGEFSPALVVAGTGPDTRNGTGAGSKRTLDERSPDNDRQDRVSKMKKLDIMDMCKQAESTMDNVKIKLGETALKLQAKTTVNEVKDRFMELFETFAEAIDKNMTIMTDMAGGIHDYQTALERKDVVIARLEDKVKDLEARRIGQDVKESQDIMGGELKLAMTQFKVLDLDLGKESEDRKEITELATRAIKSKVRTDISKDWEEAAKGAKVIPVGRKTVKRQTDKGDIWTVPVLVRIEDKESRWRAEDILRKSNVHPAFHWPQGMLEHVKTFKQELVKAGHNDKDNYIRIRPEERAGKIRIKGDVKSKAGGRFVTKAYWNVPTADATFTSRNPDLIRIQLTDFAPARRRGSARPAEAMEQDRVN